MAVIANSTTVRPEMASSRTYKDFYNFIGQHANNFGVEKLKALVTSSSTETVEENTVDTESEASSEAVDAEDKTVEAEPTAETEEEATETGDVENSSEENN